MNRVVDTGDGRVIGLDYAPMRNGFTDIHIFHSRQLCAQHALVLSMLLPTRMMSCVALRIMTHNDVYTGVGLLHFTSYVPFPKVDIHLHLDTSGSSCNICQYSALSHC